ncbi:MAG: DUF2147 domain-containing protein [Rhodoferax sp.]|nr:DUF2147 domain-containing protein [Rhodoferax sp.]
MLRSATTLALTFAASAAMAQMTPVGLWKTIDDNDGTAKSEIRIVENGGVVSGKLERDLNPKAKPDDKCVECKDDRKDQPIVGLELIRGLTKVEGKDVWQGGTIVEPSSGKIYKMIMTPIEGGKKIEMRGYVGAPLFGRTQVWIRIQ